jgi:O-antigen/teichoic acid export membrane protein
MHVLAIQGMSMRMISILSLLKRIVRAEVFKNFAILVSDRGMQMASQIFTIFVLTRYLGPEKFGVLAYSFSIFAFVFTLSNFGFDRILVVEILHGENKQMQNDILFTSIIIKLIVSSLLYSFIFLGKSLLLQVMSGDVYNAIQILSINIFFYSWVLIDGYNQSKGLFKYTAIARIWAAVLSIIIRIGMVYYKASFEWIILSFLFEQTLCLVICLFKSSGFISDIRSVRLKSFIFRFTLIRSGLYVLISGLCFVIYLKSAQAVVENTFTKTFLGVFTLALTMFEVPVSLANIMSSIFTPKLAKLKMTSQNKKANYYACILLVFVIVGIMAAVVVVLAGIILSAILKNSYTNLLSLVFRGAIAIPVLYAGYCLNMFMLSEKNIKWFMVTSITGAFVSIAFWFGVPRFLTTGNVIYFYVISQLLAALVIPIIIRRELLSHLIAMCSLVFQKNFMGQMKLALQKVLS